MRKVWMGLWVVGKWQREKGDTLLVSAEIGSTLAIEKVPDALQALGQRDVSLGVLAAVKVDLKLEIELGKILGPIQVVIIDVRYHVGILPHLKNTKKKVQKVEITTGEELG